MSEKPKWQKDKVLIVASGRTVEEISNYPYKENDWYIVAVNHAWAGCNDQWDCLVRTYAMRDLPKESDTRPIYCDKEYIAACKEFGGIEVCGMTIVLAASYWILYNLEPKVIGYLGCDMNYKPDEKGRTCFYGVGEDIEKRGISDPDKMVKSYGGEDPEYLNNLYLRFETKAKEHVGCEVFNFSSDEETRLPYRKTKPDSFK